MKPNCYTRPNRLELSVPEITRNTARETTPLASLPEPIVLDRSTECWITPLAVAKRLIDYARVDRNTSILEPSAGTGNLISAAIEREASRIVAVERNNKLVNYLREHYAQIKLHHDDFLEWECDEKFDLVVMNPPYSKVIAHVEKARQLLSPLGRVFAIVPVTRYKDHAVESLPIDTFAGIKVNTHIVELSAA
ncbi:RsmD family RNA methyltransferase [Gammaproteobacteria bacterium]|nr:RsmD family RNA methyltransferase [Gammaproteobacteria bacterium]